MNFAAMPETGYVSFSRGDSRFFLDVRHVREIVDGSGFVFAAEAPARSVKLRDARLQLVDIGSPDDRNAAHGNPPLLIVVELDRNEATPLVGIVADRIDSKLVVASRETSVAGCIDAEEIIRERLPNIAFLSAH